MQVIFITFPTVVLNLYCLLAFLWEKELRSAEFALVALQSLTEFLFAGLFTLVNTAAISLDDKFYACRLQDYYSMYFKDDTLFRYIVLHE